MTNTYLKEQYSDQRFAFIDGRGPLTRDIEIVGKTGTEWYTRWVLGEYERLIDLEKYNGMEDLEKRSKSAKNLLNLVVSRAIKRANRQGDEERSLRLINRFRQRGYDEVWLNEK